jgi:hypothetical protein
LADFGGKARDVAAAAVLLTGVGIHARAAAAPLPRFATDSAARGPIRWTLTVAALTDFSPRTRAVAHSAMLGVG